MRPDAPEESIDELILQLKQRVADRERAGEYPEGLEDELDAHFGRIALHVLPGYDFKTLRDRVNDLRRTGSFSTANIRFDTSVPGGSQLHRLVAKVVGRQTQGILAQIQRFSDALRDTLFDIVGAIESPAAHAHADLSGQLDAVFERLAAFERAENSTAAVLGLTQRVETLEAAKRREFDPWFSNERFEEAFRGDTEGLRDRYKDLAQRFAGSPGRVVDIGCGRGEFLELLIDQGIEAGGIELDPELVRAGVERGLPMEHADGIAWLRTAADSSLGGISMIQVVEHVSPQGLVDIVALAAHKLVPGAKIVVETVNPQSLYVFAHSFYLDPTHMAPVHPAYLMFLFREAGFTSVDIEWRSMPPSDDILVHTEGDDAAHTVGNANVDRLNQLLFAAQDYALVAVR